MIKPKRRPRIDALSSPVDVKRAIACEYKRRYEDLETALQSSKIIRKKIGPKTKPYKCRFCSYFHLGHHRSKKRIAIIIAKTTETHE